VLLIVVMFSPFLVPSKDLEGPKVVLSGPGVIFFFLLFAGGSFVYVTAAGSIALDSLRAMGADTGRRGAGVASILSLAKPWAAEEV
jgi:hypothetical protein